jgi:exosortase
MIDLLRKKLLLAVLLAVHVPFLIAYLSGLWRQTHYQFFPFAIGAFVWLFVTRRDRQPERWSWLTWILLAVDMACLAAQFYSYSPWLAVVGLACTLTAWCYANRDTGYDRRLTYLALLPVIVLRLPLNYDEQVIHGLQRLTTTVASKILHRFGLLHFREGNVLQFPGKSFMVEEACSGVQSLFTILFIAALVVCLKRRSFVHGILLLASGVLMAGIMNTMRVVTITVAWDKYAYDLSAGFAHDLVGYFCLAVAAMMLMSADAFLGFLSDPVPDTQTSGKVGMFLNPLTFLWNRLVAVIPDELAERKAVTAAQPRATSAAATRIHKNLDNRVLPTVREGLIPSNTFDFLLGWSKSWRSSRNHRDLLAGIPFAAATTCGLLMIWWLRHASQDPVIAIYETAFNAAAADGDESRQEIFLRALCDVRPKEPQYRFRLSQYLLRNGRPNDGLGEILRLAPESGNGMVEARMWLVQQAMSPKPLKPLTADEIERQLKLILDQAPTNVEAHQALARLYSSRKEWKLAEQHLSAAAESRPELYLDLAGLKRRLNRDPNDVTAVAQRAITALSAQLEKNRGDSTTRLALVESYVLAGQEAAGRELLFSGIEHNNDPALQTALANFDLMLVQRRLAASAINRDPCVPVVLAALSRDPGNVLGLRILTQLSTMRAEISGEALSDTIAYWRRSVEENPTSIDKKILLGQLLSDCGELEESIRTLQPLIAEHPKLRLPYAQLLKRSGREKEAIPLLETVAREADERLKLTPDDVPSLAIWAESLLSLGRAKEVREQLAARVKVPNASGRPDNASLATWYGVASIEYYDQLTGYDGDPTKKSDLTAGAAVPAISQSAEVLLALLADSLDCQQTSIQAVDRLARLSLSSHPAAAGAEEMLGQLRLDGANGAEVLNAIGLHAIVLEQCDKAVPWLEQANAMTRGSNPMILNNLATAIVRSGARSPEDALTLANQTLMLIPDHPDALATRGEVYVAMKRWNDAIADLTEALKLRKDSLLVHHLLVTAYRELSEPKMQELHLKRIEELTLRNPAD